MPKYSSMKCTVGGYFYSFKHCSKEVVSSQESPFFLKMLSASTMNFVYLKVVEKHEND